MSHKFKPPLVSICIPNYNNAHYLDICLKSALGQTYPRIEIILVDDNSSDNSLEIASQYADQIRILKNPTNLGQPQNTNKCVDLSRGEYVVILHSDDFLLPDFAAKLAPLLDEHPDAVMAVGERLLVDADSRQEIIAPFYNGNYLIPGLSQAKVFMMSSFLPCQVLVRRSVFQSVGGVDVRHIINLDGLLWFKCALKGNIAYIQDPVAGYRIHSQQTTARYNRTINHLMEYYVTLTEMFKLGNQYPYLRKFFNEAEARVAVLTLRYGLEVIGEKNYDLAGRYLKLAEVFDPDIIDTDQYQKMKSCLSLTGYRRDQAVKDFIGRQGQNKNRQFSYEPPKHSIALID